MSAFALHTFSIKKNLLLKQLDVRVEVFNTGNLHKNLYNLILKYKLDRLRPTQSKNSSRYLNPSRSLSCFPTMSITFLLAPFKRFSYFFIKY